MVDRDTVDGHLVAVLDRVIDAIHAPKQAMWAVPDTNVRRDLAELFALLGQRAEELSAATSGVGRRESSIKSPTGRAQPNLRAEAGHDRAAFRRLILDELRSVATDARTRAGEIVDTPEAAILDGLADGLDRRIEAFETIGDPGAD